LTAVGWKWEVVEKGGVEVADSSGMADELG